jgi:hypothetical protein
LAALGPPRLATSPEGTEGEGGGGGGGGVGKGAGAGRVQRESGVEGGVDSCAGLVEVVGGAGQRGEGSEVVEGGAEGVVGAGVEGKSASFSLEDARRVLFQTMLSETKASTRVRFFFLFFFSFFVFCFPRRCSTRRRPPQE